uniref:Uncharacterized protein n=1 Tax=Ficus carica TaxID=3494 RepID=A0AA88E8R7_FICCA|nr:hypothetical protein TIFTF001_038408 [Ficus carica]GMN69361.1 hypothetical protein TIFTF001_038411 [Ficus carica]
MSAEDWRKELNLKKLVHLILQAFGFVLSLKINMEKSALLGVNSEFWEPDVCKVKVFWRLKVNTHSVSLGSFTGLGIDFWCGSVSFPQAFSDFVVSWSVHSSSASSFYNTSVGSDGIYGPSVLALPVLILFVADTVARVRPELGVKEGVVDNLVEGNGEGGRDLSFICLVLSDFSGLEDYLTSCVANDCFAVRPAEIFEVAANEVANEILIHEKPGENYHDHALQQLLRFFLHLLHWLVGMGVGSLLCTGDFVVAAMPSPTGKLLCSCWTTLLAGTIRFSIVIRPSGQRQREEK